MFLTNMLLKKAKSKHVLVLTQSVVTSHRLVRIRDRLADKLEFTSFDPLIQKVTKRKRGKWRIGERPAKSLDIEIGGRFPLILNKEHKVVLFPPGFQTVQDPPGVKHDPPSFSLFLFISRPLRLFVPFLRFLIEGATAKSRSLLMLQIQFLLSPDHCPQEKGEDRRDYILERESFFYLSRLCV
ncbi:39S ribosomal protein L33, mitochondrial [Atta colombica]|uniref:39S ribosomal protein L33, mitochondrial n=1 Tax=Atta colombica TaxID=520822 RepID=A0A151I1S8_9HYME|nr:39S ribosomal protein L33, mitochondrial [Atta colombica]